MSTISREQAEAVLDAIKDLLPAHRDDFKLYPAEHEELPEGSWSIAAEGFYPEGDFWTYYVMRHLPHQSRFPTIFIEPLYDWCLGLYPKG